MEKLANRFKPGNSWETVLPIIMHRRKYARSSSLVTSCHLLSCAGLFINFCWVYWLVSRTIRSTVWAPNDKLKKTLAFGSFGTATLMPGTPPNSWKIKPWKTWDQVTSTSSPLSLLSLSLKLSSTLTSISDSLESLSLISSSESSWSLWKSSKIESLKLVAMLTSVEWCERFGLLYTPLRHIKVMRSGQHFIGWLSPLTIE